MKIKYIDQSIKEEVNELFRETLSYDDGICIDYGDTEDEIDFTDKSGGNMFYYVLVDLVAKYNIDFVDYYHFVINHRKENVEAS